MTPPTKAGHGTEGLGVRRDAALGRAGTAFTTRVKPRVRPTPANCCRVRAQARRSRAVDVGGCPFRLRDRFSGERTAPEQDETQGMQEGGQARTEGGQKTWRTPRRGAPPLDRGAVPELWRVSEVDRQIVPAKADNPLSCAPHDHAAALWPTAAASSGDNSSRVASPAAIRAAHWSCGMEFRRAQKRAFRFRTSFPGSILAARAW